VLFAGRLLGWKGAHLAIRAVADAIAYGASIHLTIVGTGPLLVWEKAIASELGISHAITWVGQIPQKSLFELYERMHCFLFPSLHDSSGNVVLEAMSFGLPIVCLDVGGPATLVDESCATIVSTKGASEAMVVKDLSAAIARLQQDEVFRSRQAASAMLQANAMSWSSRVNGAVKLASTRSVGMI
jgi:glycosyltransferase involved in cell wall biosynthesis